TKQEARDGSSAQDASSVFAASVIDQAVHLPGPEPVAYVASNRSQLISLGFNEAYDNNLDFYDGNHDGRDDRVLAMKDLAPTGIAIDVRAVSKVSVHGQEKDLALLLGPTRLWIFDVTNARDPQQVSSFSFAELGGPTDYARH